MKTTQCKQVALCAFMLAAGCFMLLSATATSAMDAPARVHVLVPTDHMTYEGLMGGVPSAFLYRQSDDRFYMSTYGSNLATTI